MYQQIPLTSEPNQEFEVTLQIDGENKNYKFNVRWNRVASYWVITITDQSTGEIVLDSVPLVSGGDVTSDILLAHYSLKLGAGYLMSIVDTPNSDSPNMTNLGEDFALIWDGEI